MQMGVDDAGTNEGAHERNDAEDHESATRKNECAAGRAFHGYSPMWGGSPLRSSCRRRRRERRSGIRIPSEAPRMRAACRLRRKSDDGLVGG